MALAGTRRLRTTGAQGRLAAKSSNVILITIDTLRADYVGAYGSSRVQTPALDSLANDGVLFSQAYCQVPLTPPSHASILTGLYPATHGVRDFSSGGLRPGSTTLATMLRSRGYKTAAFISALVLETRWGLNQGFDLYYDHFNLDEMHGVSPGNVQRRAAETMAQVLKWLKARPAGPFLLWVHLYDPHHDYDPPEPFRSRYASNLYAGEVAYADSEISRLLNALKQSGDYENSLIVATSDHGESLGEHREHEHGFFVYEPTVRIPLIFKLPASYQAGKKKPALIAQTVDIVPTILQVLGIPQQPSWKIEGRGLLSAMLGKPAAAGSAYAETLYPRSTFGWSELQMLREGKFKFILAPEAELYDLSQDPGETRNLYSSNQSISNQMRDRIRTLSANFTATPAGSVADDPERVERLAALGYVAVSQPVALPRGKALEDPKKTIEIYNTILKGLQAAEVKDIKASNSILSRVAAAHPELFIVHYSIGMNELRLGNPTGALAAFDKARNLNPDFGLIDVNAARALALLGNNDEAVELLRKVVKKNPSHISALHQLGLVLTRAQRYGEAAQAYREILKQRPDDRQARKLLGIALVEDRNYAEGLKLLEEANSAGVDDAMTQNFLGIALANTGRLTDALIAYRKALQIKPDYDQARLNLSFALLRSGNRPEALKEFDELCRTNPRMCKRYESQFR
jgi:arylsulfatase A-like enzyme/Flp pilus assembly protein TadD